jgi:hypothetical protein
MPRRGSLCMYISVSVGVWFCAGSGVGGFVVVCALQTCVCVHLGPVGVVPIGGWYLFGYVGG